MMDDRIRISDADRERVTARLREHYAEGRLTSEELDERVTATLNAKTYGELRRVLADMPESDQVAAPGGPVPPRGGTFPSWAGQPRFVYRRGPRLFPLVLFALILAIALPGAGFVFFAFLKILLLFWLVACVAGIIAVGRFHRHARRYWQSGNGNQWRHHGWHD
jgi:hypothetical protein